MTRAASQTLHLTPLLRLSSLPPLTALSHGLGQDSAMLLAAALDDPAFRRRYVPGRLVVLAADTGNEHNETVRYKQEVSELCKSRGVDFIHITPDMGYHSPVWQNLHTQWKRNKTIQGRLFPKSCSVNLKIGPFYKALNDYIAREYGYQQQVGNNRRAALYAYAQDYGPVQVMIGFSRGEERRVKPAPAGFMQKTVERIYPLIDLGLDRQGCHEGIRALGHTLPMPSNCQHCPFHRPADLVRLFREDEASFEQWADFEHVKLTAEKWQHTRNHTVFGNDKTLWENLADGLREYGHLSREELTALRMTRGHGNTTGF